MKPQLPSATARSSDRLRRGPRCSPGSSPARRCSSWRRTREATREYVASVFPPWWAVMMVFGACHSGWSLGSGSGSVTSSAARRRPDWSSASSASVSTTAPRATLTTSAPSGSAASVVASRRWWVSGDPGTVTTTMSAWRSSGTSSSMPWTPSRAVRATSVISTSKGTSRSTTACATDPAPITSTRRSASDESSGLSNGRRAARPAHRPARVATPGSVRAPAPTCRWSARRARCRGSCPVAAGGPRARTRPTAASRTRGRGRFVQPRPPLRCAPVVADLYDLHALRDILRQRGQQVPEDELDAVAHVAQPVEQLLSGTVTVSTQRVCHPASAAVRTSPRLGGPRNVTTESRQHERGLTGKDRCVTHQTVRDTTTPAMTSSTVTTIAYVALALTWGSSFLLMKVALQEFTPAQVALGRILVGATTLTTLMVATRRTWPRERRLWGHMAVRLGVPVRGPVPALRLGRVDPAIAGIGAILNSTTPIWTAVAMTAIIRGNRLTRGQLAGIALGAVGVLLIMGVWQVVTAPAFLGSLPAQAACLGATASYGLAFAWMERFVNRTHTYDSVTIASVQLAGAAAISVVLVPFVALTPVVPHAAPTLSLLALGALGTGVAYVWNTRVVITWGSLVASTVTYLTPVVGVVLGIAVLGETMTWHEPLGAVVVIVSVMLVQKRIPAVWPRTRG